MIEQINGVASAAVKAPATPAKEAKADVPKIASVVDTAPISPRLRFDAVSGVVVTEFLNKGTVQNQTPSAAALAYLRMGLEPDGHSKTDNAEGTTVEA